MDNKIIIDLNLLKIILDTEAKKLTGKTMKRFELSDNKDEIKKQVKEIQYEFMRDLFDLLQTGKVIIDFKQSMENKGE